MQDTVTRDFGENESSDAPEGEERRGKTKEDAIREREGIFLEGGRVCGELFRRIPRQRRFRCRSGAESSHCREPYCEGFTFQHRC